MQIHMIQLIIQLASQSHKVEFEGTGTELVTEEAN